MEDGIEPIAIVGTGCRFPGASASPSQLWKLLCRPPDLLKEVPPDRFKIDAFYHPDVNHHGTTNVRHGYFLDEDIQQFDAGFFNVSPAEATSMDPQQRLLLETVYESLERGGFRIDALRGSSTGVFCGYLHNDYAHIQASDMDTYPPYALVGNSPSMMANRVSYYFDWKGPSLSINTGCSSSLLAVHLAVQALRRGECSMAVAAASNLLLGPDIFITACKTGMLSPSGQCRMWDDRADGYGRGEGVATVVLKRLTDAIAAGDRIECLIRATGTNADGRTLGILMPSGEAQQELIERTYASLGLDPKCPDDRCQYFEAHGTGTQAGDPQEATGIYNAFFGGPVDQRSEDSLYVGSIKTVIGHTEATAGLAGLIKASLCLQHAMIVPNRLLQNLNPKIASMSSRLRVPISCLPWPDRDPGTPRRASVNSFGFGGTNVHVILDSYDHVPSPDLALSARCMLPFTFSATSERSLRAVLERFSRFLQQYPDVRLLDLASTLLTRRSAFSHRIFLLADSTEELLTQVQRTIQQLKAPLNSLTIRAKALDRPMHILGVFTGQGAQWPQMGLDLLDSCPATRGWLSELQQSLDELPQPYRPNYRLIDELSAPEASSRLHEALIAQPLSTAIQIIQVNLLRSLGVSFFSVIGHSSGEIAAAYAAGLLNARDTIRVAYLRGLASQHAGSGRPGSMMAVDLSWSQAQSICEQEPYGGKVKVAAYNSPSSVTLSGDADVIRELNWLLQSLEKSPVILRVSTAYHSHHMTPCAKVYLQALRSCDIEVGQQCARWFSSVFDGKEIQNGNGLDGEYWKENMLRPVSFAQAAMAAVAEKPDIDAIVEIGTHSALRGPIMQSIETILKNPPPYIAMARRSTSNIQTLVSAIGSLWAHVGPGALNIVPYNSLFDQGRPLDILWELPAYPFDHTERYWSESRLSHARSHRRIPPNDLLGIPIFESGEINRLWRIYFRREELPWLEDGQVRPAIYVSMTVEAATQVANGNNLQLLEISNLVIHREVSIPDTKSGIEILYKLDGMHPTRPSQTDIIGSFTCLVAVGKEEPQRCASGQVTITLGPSVPTLLPTRAIPNSCLRLQPVVDQSLSQVISISQLTHWHNTTSTVFASPKARKGLRPLLHLDPKTLDASIDVLFEGLRHHGHSAEQRPILHIVDRIAINPACYSSPELVVDAVVTQADGERVWGAVDLFDHSGQGILQLEGIQMSVSPEISRERPIFSEFIWQSLQPDATSGSSLYAQYVEESSITRDRLALLYLRYAQKQLTADKRLLLSPAAIDYVVWMDDLLATVASNGHSTIRPEWLDETPAGFRSNYPDAHLDDRLLATDRIGQQLSNFLSVDLQPILRSPAGQDPILPQSKSLYEPVAKVVQELAIFHPQMQVLEISDDTTLADCVLRDLVNVPLSYTCSRTPVNVAADSRVIVKAMDITGNLISQGHDESSFDLIIANDVLDGSSAAPTLQGLRRLLRPGGYLILLEAAKSHFVHLAFRPHRPIRTREEWTALLVGAGFSGIDTANTSHEAALSGISVMVTQAVDENIELLRNPMNISTQPLPEKLFIFGQGSAAPLSLVADIRLLMVPIFQDIIHVWTPADENFNLLNQSSAVLVLPEQNPFDSGQLTVLQHLSSTVQPVLWVTIEDGNQDQAGFQDLLESSPARIQHLHVIDTHAITAHLLATTLMRWINSQRERQWQSVFAGAAEKKLRLHNGIMKVPRQVPKTSMNRRLWMHEHLVDSHQVKVEGPTSVTSPAKLIAHSSQVLAKNLVSTQLRVCFSTLNAIPVLGGFLYLVLGVDIHSKSRVLSLSEENCGLVSSPSLWSWNIPSSLASYQEPAYLAAVASALRAMHVLHECDLGANLLIHNTDPIQRLLIMALARERKLTVFFSTSNSVINADEKGLLFLHPHSSLRSLRQQLPSKLDVVASLDPADDGFIARIVAALHPETAVAHPAVCCIFVNVPLSKNVDVPSVGTALATAAMLLSDHSSLSLLSRNDIVALKEITSLPAHLQVNPRVIIDWTAARLIPAQIRPAHATISFSPHRSYILMGLQAPLAQSVCEWMASRGAQHIIFMDTNLDAQWAAKMTNHIKIMTLPAW